jgi:hypothetical protein
MDNKQGITNMPALPIDNMCYKLVSLDAKL